MSSLLFNGFFYGWTATSVIFARLLAVLPGRAHVEAFLRLWAKGVRAGMAFFAGITVVYRGDEHLPASGPFIIAAKHQSYCDGILLASRVKDLAIVANKGILKLPLFGGLLRRLEMIMVENCGGGHGQTPSLIREGRMAAAKGRSILIYPEGQLMPVGATGRYRSGIFHLYADLQVPVVPVATNIGRCWPQNERLKRKGRATVEFLAPIPPGLSREDFMAKLESGIEGATRRLEAEAA